MTEYSWNILHYLDEISKRRLKMPYTDQRAMLSKLQILTERIENATVKISGGAVHPKAAKSSTDLRTVVAMLEAVVAKLEGGSVDSAAGTDKTL